MTEQELDILAQDSSRELIERHIGEDPARAALRLGPHAALLSTQIKYLQRAKTKLPSYHRARCIIPPLAFEQASSEAAAEAKTYEGGLCIDLTCGLGVDSLMLSRRFRRVVSLERDPVLALVARYNFERLEARNIEVICTSAETFVAEFAGTADLIYARHGPAGSTRSIASHGNRPGHPDLSPGAAARRKAGRRIRPSLRIPARPRRLALQNPGGPLLPAIGRRIRRLGNRLRVCTTFARRFPRTRVSDRRDRAVSSQGLENSVQNARHRTAEPAEKGFSARCRANRPGDRHPAGRQRHGGFHDGERATDRRHTVGRRTRKGQATLRTIHYICRTIDTQ